jgi:succinoglycan biosynthesis transport protein ExoP
MRHSHFTGQPDESGPRQADTSVDLGLVFVRLMEKAWLIALCVAITVLGAAYYFHAAPRRFEATATVQVEQEEQRVVKIEQVIKEDLRSLETLNTIVQKLRSRALLERVMDRRQLAGTTPAPGNSTELEREEVLANLELSVRPSLRRNTRLIDIKVTQRSPQLAAQIANSVVEEYLSQDFEGRSSSTRGAYTFLRDEADRLGKKLESSEQALQAYRVQVGSADTLQSQDLVLAQLRELSARISQSRSETIRLRAAFEHIQKSKGNVWQMLSAPQMTSDPSVMEARTVLAKAEGEFARILERYKEKHPKHVQAASQLRESRRAISNAVTQVADSLRIGYENALAVERDLVKDMSNSEAAALKLNQQAIRYSLLAREVESDRALFDSVVNRLKETSLTTDMQPEKIRIVQFASAPMFPAAPRASMVFGIALLGGLLVGAGLVIGLGILDSALHTVDEAEQFLGLAVLSSIPKLKRLKPSGSPWVPEEGRHSMGAEAIRTLRTSLSMLDRKKAARSFLFTSAFPGEGKSFNALNFATSLAQQGLRTLLIDADLRRPNIAAIVDADGDPLAPGVTEYLLGQNSLEEIVHTKSPLKNFYYASAGAIVPNPVELLAQGRFGRLVEESLKQFDRVVVDSAPVQTVSDTLLIADAVETTVLVIDGTRTPRQAVARALQRLRAAGANVGGGVLNLMPWRQSQAYGSGYSYFGGGCYGSRRRPQRRPSTSTLPTVALAE